VEEREEAFISDMSETRKKSTNNNKYFQYGVKKNGGPKRNKKNGEL